MARLALLLALGLLATLSRSACHAQAERALTKRFEWGFTMFGGAGAFAPADIEAVPYAARAGAGLAMQLNWGSSDQVLRQSIRLELSGAQAAGLDAGYSTRVSRQIELPLIYRLSKADSHAFFGVGLHQTLSFRRGFDDGSSQPNGPPDETNSLYAMGPTIEVGSRLLGVLEASIRWTQGAAGLLPQRGLTFHVGINL